MEEMVFYPGDIAITDFGLFKQQYKVEVLKEDGQCCLCRFIDIVLPVDMYYIDNPGNQRILKGYLKLYEKNDIEVDIGEIETLL